MKIVSNDNFREYIGNVEDFDFSETWVREHVAGLSGGVNKAPETHENDILGGGFKHFLFKVCCPNSLPAGNLVLTKSSGVVIAFGFAHT